MKGWLARHLPAATRRRLKSVYRRGTAPLRSTRRRLHEGVGRERLTADLAAAGIGPGDTIMVHSSLSRIGSVEGGADTVIESLIESVTEEGTVLMPTFDDAETVFADFADGRLTDLRTARSLTGTITEVFRARPDVRRSSHPFSSVCAWGRHADEVTRNHQGDPRIAHADSPFGHLLELGGKVVGLGVSLGPVSFYHTLEDTWDGFPTFPYLPAEELTYVDPNGRTVAREIRRYDPGIKRTRIDQPESGWIRSRLTEHFRRKGILHEFRFGEADSWLMEARPFYDELKRLAEKGVTIYLTEAEWESRGEPIESW